MLDLLMSFMKNKISEAKIYNEFSFQHELGFFLREENEKRCPGYVVQFERNISFFEEKKAIKIIDEPVKREMDIVLFNWENIYDDKYAIELKYPRKGSYDKRMWHFLDDLKFMQQVKSAGFSKTFCITLVNDNDEKSESLFHQGNGNKEPYSFFRNRARIKNYRGVLFDKEHIIKWENVAGTDFWWYIEEL